MSLLPQFGFIELMVIAVVALIVVGPKDLPKLMRTCGRMVSKARRMAGEFTSAFDEMARESEVDELRKEMESMRFEDIGEELKEEVDMAFKPISDEIDQAVKAGQTEGAKANAAAKSLPSSAPSQSKAPPAKGSLIEETVTPTENS